MGWIETAAEYDDAIDRGWLTEDGILTQEGKDAMDNDQQDTR